MPLTGWKLTLAVNVALVTAQVAFGGYHVIGKIALDNGTNPIIFAFYREISAGPLLLIIAAIVERFAPNPKDWWRFLLLGSIGVYGNQLLFVLGLSLTSATQAAIMQPAIPVFTTLITLILRTEKFSSLKLLGILASAAGAVVTVGFRGISLRSDKFIGTMCLVGNTLCTSIYYILMKPVLKTYPPITVTGIAYMVGAVEMGLTSLMFVFKRETDLYHIHASAAPALVYAILIATALAYTCVTFANSKAPASLVAAYASLQPLTAATLSFFFLPNEKFTWMEGVGGALILLGLGLVTFARSRETKAEKENTLASEDTGVSSRVVVSETKTPGSGEDERKALLN